LEILKPNDVAQWLAVSRAWVYEAAKTGRIPSIRIGGEDGPLRFVREDVERWLDEARGAWSPARPRKGIDPQRRIERRPSRQRDEVAVLPGQQSLL
jgi:excisionase family DNA binding protein